MRFILGTRGRETKRRQIFGGDEARSQGAFDGNNQEGQAESAAGGVGSHLRDELGLGVRD